MGKFTSKVTDALGFTDYKGEKKAVQRATRAQQQSLSEQLANARQEMRILERAGRDAQSYQRPYVEMGRAAIPGMQQLLTTEGQYDYLSSNPMFQAAVENAADVMTSRGAAAGKFNSGGTVDQLFKNYLATGEDFIGSQYSRLFNTVGAGQTAASNMGNIILDTASGVGGVMGDMRSIMGGQGDVASAGIIARENASQRALEGGMQTIQNIFSGNGVRGGGSIPGLGPVSQVGGALSSFGPFLQGMGGGQGIAGMFSMSDERVKTDVEEIDRDELGGIYKFRYVGSKKQFIGRMAQELMKTKPDAVREIDGYLWVSEEFAPRAA